MDPLASIVKRDDLQRKENWKQEAIRIEQSSGKPKESQMLTTKKKNEIATHLHTDL